MFVNSLRGLHKFFLGIRKSINEGLKSNLIVKMSEKKAAVSGGGEALLKKWWELRQQIKQLEKEENDIREKIKTAMITKKLAQLRGGDYRVIFREMTRDTLSKKDCPPEIWSRYAKHIKYHWIKVEHLGLEDIEEVPEE